MRISVVDIPLNTCHDTCEISTDEEDVDDLESSERQPTTC